MIALPVAGRFSSGRWLWYALCPLLVLGSFVGSAAAQQRGAADTGAASGVGAGSQATADTAALVFNRRTVAVFRTSLGALSPADRAVAATTRIEALAASAGETGAVPEVEVRRIPEGVLVTAGGRGVFTLTRGDADTLRGETLGDLEAAAAARLQQVLDAERELRSLPHLLRAIGLAALATVLFLVALRIIRWLRALALTRLPNVAGPRLPGLSIGGFNLLTAGQLLGFVRRLVDLIGWGSGLFAAYLWLVYVLTRFAYSRPWGETLGAYLSTTVKDLALTAVSGIPGLFTVVLIFIATRWMARLVSTFFDAVEAGGVAVPWIHPETANPTKRIASVLLWLFAIVVAYPYVPGSGSDVFKGVSVFAGLVISLGSSGVVSQAMSGLVLMYSRALKPGDYVRLGEIEGTVTTLGMLSTKVRTNKREEVTLPNAVVVAAGVKNYSRLIGDGGLVLHTSVTIGYDTPWRQVEALLLMAAGRTDGLETQPPPFVHVVTLGDFNVEFQLNAHLSDPVRRIPVLSALHREILDCFNEYGVQIMSPHYEQDPPTPFVVPRERWYAAPATTPHRPDAEPAAVRDLR